MKLRKLGWMLYYPLVTLLLLEAALWLLAYRPYQHQSFRVEASPSNWLEGDSIMGFRLGVGEFTLSINEGLHFKTTHLASGRRSLGLSPESSSLKVDLYGCSYTYGYGLDDSLTMGWRLAAALPNARVRSWAVPGYGSTQALLQLQKQMRQLDTPDVVVIAYASFHDERNSLNAEFRRGLSLGFSQNTDSQHIQSFRYPYLDANDQIQYQAWGGLYKHWPGRSYSALINAVQSSTEFWQKANRDKAKRSGTVLTQIAQLCGLAGIEMIFFPLTEDEATQQLLSQMEAIELSILDASLDLSQTQFQNYPYDTHPNARAHAHYAGALLEYLRQKGR
ncbi:MAG: hypothetical protein AB8H47_31140 [Bacteroidia bacterium]